MSATKITQLANTRPLLSLNGILGGSSGGGPSGQVPTANGSNSVAWGSNVALITSNASNALLGPFVNFASGSNILFTLDVGPFPQQAIPSNTLRIHAGVKVADEGTTLFGLADTINFVGTGVVASGTGQTKTVTVTSGGFTQAYVGYNTVGASNEAPVNKKVLATKITTTGAVELLTVECHLKTNTGTPGVLMWGVWEDNAGVPRTLYMADGSETASFLFSPGSDRYRWCQFPCGIHLSASTSYWIGIMFDGSFQVHYDTSGADHSITSGGWWLPDWDFYTDSDTTKKYSIRGSTIA